MIFVKIDYDDSPPSHEFGVLQLEAD